jgi:hypothetical protein
MYQFSGSAHEMQRITNEVAKRFQVTIHGSAMNPAPWSTVPTASRYPFQGRARHSDYHRNRRFGEWSGGSTDLLITPAAVDRQLDHSRICKSNVLRLTSHWGEFSVFGDSKRQPDEFSILAPEVIVHAPIRLCRGSQNV